MTPAPAIMPMSTSFVPATPSSTTRQASTSALSCERSTSVSVACEVVLAVLIEPLPGLLAVVAGVDQLLHRGRHVEAVAVAVAQVLRHVEHGVEAEHVGQEERPHRRRLGLRHDLVDVLD